MSDVDLLSSLYVFRDVPRSDLEALLSLTPPQQFDADHVLFKQGDRSDVAILVVDGKLEATIEAGGKLRRVGEIRPGEVVGENALFHPLARRSATVTALEKSRGLVISRELMDKGMDSRATVALETYLLGTMARRIRQTNRTLMQAWKESAPKETPVAEAAKAGGSLLDNLRRLFSGGN